MRFKAIDYEQRGVMEMSAEIKPDWRKFTIVALIIIALFGAVMAGQYLFNVSKVLAAESLYHHLEREWPRENSLVYVPFLDCLHLARFDSRTKLFYDNKGWLAADKWLYVTDRWPAEAKTCTTEDR